MKKSLVVLTVVIMLFVGFCMQVQAKSEFILDEAGVLWGKGDNQYGQLGFDSNGEKVEDFVKITDNVKEFTGSTTVYAVKNDDSVWAWGYNEKGNCGTGNTENVFEPTKIIDSAAQTYFNNGAVVLDKYGKLYVWGNNTISRPFGVSYGAKGLGVDVEFAAAPLVLLEDVKEFFEGSVSYFSEAVYIVKNNGELYGFGCEASDLGLGTTPEKVEGISNVKNIVVSGYMAIAETYDNEVYVCGSYPIGTWSATTRTEVFSLKFKKIFDNVKEIIEGSDSTAVCVIKHDDTLWGWGYRPNFGIETGENFDYYMNEEMLLAENVKSAEYVKRPSMTTNLYVLKDSGDLYISRKMPVAYYGATGLPIQKVKENVLTLVISDVEEICEDGNVKLNDGSVWFVGNHVLEKAMGEDIKENECVSPPTKIFIKINVNGTSLNCDTAPYIKNDRTMVPMRAIFEALGATVTWDNEARTAIGVKGDAEVKITIGENALCKNGEIIALDAAAELTNDRTMVPVRAISEAFGAKVLWDNDNKIVQISLSDDLKVIRIGTHAAYEDDPYNKDCTMSEEEKTAAIKALDKVAERLGVKIEFVQYTTSDYRKLIAESIAEGNRFCDLAVLWAGSEKSAINKDILQPLDAYADIFDGQYPLKSKVGGNYYLMSRNFSFVNTWPIVYNIQMLDTIPELKEADGTTLYPAELYYRGEWTFSAFEKYMEKIKAHCDSYTGLNAYYAPVPFETNYMYFASAALHSVGAGIYDGENINAGTDNAQKACEYVAKLFDKGLVSCSSAEKHVNDTGWTTGSDTFLQERTYFTNCAIWKTGDARNPIGIVPFPRPDDESISYRHINFGTDSVGLVKGVDEETRLVALMAYKMYAEEYCKALAGVDTMDEFADKYAVADAKSFGIDTTHPEIGQYHADIWAEYGKTPVNEYSEAFELLYKWSYIFGQCTFGEEGFDGYTQAVESIE